MKLELKPEDIAYPQGLEIGVEGFVSDPTSVKPCQVFIEVYEGSVHVWGGEGEDPIASVEILPVKESPLVPQEVTR